MVGEMHVSEPRRPLTRAVQAHLYLLVIAVEQPLAVEGGRVIEVVKGVQQLSFRDLGAQLRLIIGLRLLQSPVRKTTNITDDTEAAATEAEDIMLERRGILGDGE